MNSNERLSIRVEKMSSPKRKHAVDTKTTKLDLSGQNTESLEGINNFPNARFLKATNTKVETLLGVKPHNNLREISLAGSPFALYEHYRIMLLVSINSQLEIIDHEKVTKDERQQAIEIADNVRSYLENGWNIVELSPLSVQNDEKYRVLEDEFGNPSIIDVYTSDSYPTIQSDELLSPVEIEVRTYPSDLIPNAEIIVTQPIHPEIETQKYGHHSRKKLSISDPLIYDICSKEHIHQRKSRKSPIIDNNDNSEPSYDPTLFLESNASELLNEFDIIPFSSSPFSAVLKALQINADDREHITAIPKLPQSQVDLNSKGEEEESKLLIPIDSEEMKDINMSILDGMSSSEDDPEARQKRFYF